MSNDILLFNFDWYIKFIWSSIPVKEQQQQLIHYFQISWGRLEVKPKTKWKKESNK